MVQSETPNHLLRGDLARALAVPASRLDLNSSFTQHGGDSIAALRLVSAWRLRGRHVGVGRILKSHSLYELLSSTAVLDEAPERPAETPTKQLFQQNSPQTLNSTPDEYPPHNHHECRAPVTHTQKSFLAHHQTPDAQDSTLHLIETWPADQLDRVKAAWTDALASEPIFSTSFLEHGPDTLLQGRDFVTPVWEEHDATSKEELLLRTTTASHSPLARDEPSRFTAITLRSDPRPRTTIVWAVDHARIDWFSLSLLRGKLHARLRGERIVEGPCFVRYAAALARFQNAGEARAVEFWARERERFGCAEAQFQLRPREGLDASETRVSDVGTVDFEFAVERLRPVAAGWRVPVAMLYHAAWASVCATLADADRVCFGVVLSGRSVPLPHVESVVGPVIRTLPLTVCVDRFADFRGLATHLVERLADLSEHAWTLPKHGYSSRFESALDVIHMPCHDRTAGTKALGTPEFLFRSGIPWSVVVQEEAVRIVYHSHRYSASTARTVSDLFENALVRIADSMSACTHSEIVTLPGPMESMLRSYGQCHSPQTRSDPSIVDLVTLFQRTADVQKDSIAIEKGHETLTYGQLDHLSSQMAAQLVMWIKPEEPVGVLADRSIYWLVAMYGVLKARGVYYPVSPSLSTSMLDEQFLAAKAKVFISPHCYSFHHRPSSCILMLVVDDLITRQSALSPGGPTRLKAPSITSPAYLCFTSGTSGLPKGVLCRHESLVAFQRDFNVRLRSRPGWRVAQIMSPSFDGSIHEIFSALSYGATLVLPDDDNMFQHLRSVDSAILTPTVASAVHPDDVGDLSTLYLVGEAVSQDTCDRWTSSKTVFNMYGPTEATGGATIKQLSANVPVTIGKPNPSSRVYILDHKRRLTPPGVVGEIFLAGVQVSSGYVDSKGEMEKHFFPDRVCPETGEQMYRTGDRGYWTDRGEIRLLGRQDRQVKLKGFRINLDDIEARIQNFVEGCQSVACFIKEDTLHAVVCAENLHLTDVKAAVSSHLPSYMRPRKLSLVEFMPLTQAGKTDVKALANGIETYDLENELTTELTASEGQLASIWRDVLPVTVGHVFVPSSRLFDFGGDSLSAMEIRSQISRKLGVEVTLRQILEVDNLRQMARLVDAALSTPRPDSALCIADADHQTVSDHDTRNNEPSLLEVSWWERYRNIAQPQAINVSLACNLSSSLITEQLAEAWNSILARHPILSSRFQQVDGRIRRVTSNRPPRVLLRSDLDIHHEVNIPFSLPDEHLIRVYLCSREMLIVASHIICDLTSLRHMLEEVKSTYLNTKPPPETITSSSILPPRCELLSEESYQQWANWLFDRPSPSLSRAPPPSIISQPKPEKGTSQVFEIRSRLLPRIRAFTRRLGMTAHQFLLAVTAMALTTERDAPAIDIVLGAPHVNRHSEREATAVGLFLQPLPVRVRWPPHVSTPLEDAQDGEGAVADAAVLLEQHDTTNSARYLRGYLRSVRRASEFALGNAVSYPRLRERCVQEGYVGDERDLFDVMVTFHEQGQWRGSLLEEDGMMVPKMTWSEGAKFPCLFEWTAAGGGGDREEGVSALAGARGADTYLILRVEHTQSWASDEQVRVLASKMVTIAACIVDGGDCEAIQEALSWRAPRPRGVTDDCQGHEDSSPHVREIEDAFGMVLR